MLSYLAKIVVPRSLMIGALSVLAACEDPVQQVAAPPPPPKITVAKPVVKDIMEMDDFTGRFRAKEEVEIRARVSGYLEKVHFRDGALVKKGDLLFSIDARPFQAEFENASSAVEVAQTVVDLAKDEFDRAVKLRKSGTISESTLDERRQRYLSARGDISGAQARLRSARLNLEYTKILAPLSGHIGRKLISEGNIVQSNTTMLASVVAIDPIHFYFDVDERSYLAYARQAENGQRALEPVTPLQVKIKLTDEDEARHVGYLDFMNNRIDDATGTMRARAVLSNKDLFLQPGLFGRISIPGSPLYKGILIPDEAIGSDQNRRIVFVVGENNVVNPVAIRPGPRIDGYRVVRKGLNGDENLVINGLMRIRPGMKIDPQMTELPLTATAE